LQFIYKFKQLITNVLIQEPNYNFV